jgi:uncharacterized protein YnzC (UPF0291/DUF896 family)
MNLSEEDPVKKVWRNQVSLPEHKNWWCDVQKLMEKYSIQLSEEEVTAMSKETFKLKVKEAVKSYAFEKLKEECRSKSKTQHITYEEFSTQDYIKEMYPDMAKIVFKCRSRTLNIKDHTKYQNSDCTCRWCGVADETLEHVVNCGSDGLIADVDEIVKELNSDKLEDVARRVENFLSKVEI